MFVKLVKETDWGKQKVVFEAESVEFVKRKALGETEPLPDSPYALPGYMPYMPFDFPHGEEYFDIFLGGRQQHVAAGGCMMYIMNDDGKTVDAESCE